MLPGRPPRLRDRQGSALELYEDGAGWEAGTCLPQTQTAQQPSRLRAGRTPDSGDSAVCHCLPPACHHGGVPGRESPLHPLAALPWRGKMWPTLWVQGPARLPAAGRCWWSCLHPPRTSLGCEGHPAVPGWPPGPVEVLFLQAGRTFVPSTYTGRGGGFVPGNRHVPGLRETARWRQTVSRVWLL